jgi:hypothetical protein
MSLPSSTSQSFIVESKEALLKQTKGRNNKENNKDKKNSLPPLFSKKATEIHWQTKNSNEHVNLKGLSI